MFGLKEKFYFLTSLITGLNYFTIRDNIEELTKNALCHSKNT